MGTMHERMGGRMPVVRMRFKYFIDKPRLKRLFRDAAMKQMARAAGWLQKVAQRSMRSRQKPSLPGQPPHAHERPLLKRLLVFGYDRANTSWVIGPEKLGGMYGEAPSDLEFGDVVTLKSATPLRRRATRPVRSGARGRPRKAAKYDWLPKGTKIKVAPRPYMAPALDKALQRNVIPEQFRNSVRGP